jgi:hypothetical protein
MKKKILWSIGAILIFLVLAELFSDKIGMYLMSREYNIQLEQNAQRVLESPAKNAKIPTIENLINLEEYSSKDLSFLMTKGGTASTTNRYGTNRVDILFGGQKQIIIMNTTRGTSSIGIHPDYLALETKVKTELGEIASSSSGLQKYILELTPKSLEKIKEKEVKKILMQSVVMNSSSVSAYYIKEDLLIVRHINQDYPQKINFSIYTKEPLGPGLNLSPNSKVLCVNLTESELDTIVASIKLLQN